MDVLKVLNAILDELARGHAVTPRTIDDALTLDQAADLLDVSGPFVQR